MISSSPGHFTARLHDGLVREIGARSLHDVIRAFALRDLRRLGLLSRWLRRQLVGRDRPGDFRLLSGGRGGLAVQIDQCPDNEQHAEASSGNPEPSRSQRHMNRPGSCDFAKPALRGVICTGGRYTATGRAALTTRDACRKSCMFTRYVNAISHPL
jgi:hypothetical protein